MSMTSVTAKMTGDSEMQPDNHGIDPAEFAESTRALLNEDPRRYRNYGAYWFFVKALLKRYYDRHAMPILGDYDDPTVNERIPADARMSLGTMLAAAAEEYQRNASFNLGRNEVSDDDGEFFLIVDPDVEG